MKSKEESLSIFLEFCLNSISAHDIDPAIEYTNYIVDRMELNEEQILWLCFLYGITYQLPSAWVIWNEFPDLELVSLERLSEWWPNASKRLPFQQDKMKQRKDTVATIASYKSMVGDSQVDYFSKLLSSSDPQVNFDKLWTPSKSIAYFGRFSIWNWAQALKHVAGLNIEPTNLMLGEPDSISFTDGLSYAFAMYDRITYKEIGPNGKKRKVVYSWSEKEKADMERACTKIKSILGIDYFQLETLACAFKKIWRTNDSRYVGYYNDRVADDIRKTASYNWYGVDWDLLWGAREYCVPASYIHQNQGVDRAKFSLTPEQKIRA